MSDARSQSLLEQNDKPVNQYVEIKDENKDAPPPYTLTPFDRKANTFSKTKKQRNL